MVQAVVERSALRCRRRALSELIGADGTIDWSPWYLSEEEDMGQGGEQNQIVDVLVSSLKQLARERDWRSVLVASDQFFAWVKHAGRVQISPDVYLLDNPLPIEQALPRRWETWRPEHRPPRFAVEIVSEGNWRKDYAISPRYDHLGTSELVIVDPMAFLHERDHPVRVPLQVYRRHDRGEATERLARVYRGVGPSYSTELDAFLHLVRVSPGRMRVRVSRDPDGHSMVLTATEQAEQERTRAEQEKARAEQERTRAEQEKAQAEQERTRAEQEKARAEQEKARAEQERTRAEQERTRAEQEKARADAADAEIERLRASLQALRGTS